MIKKIIMTGLVCFYTASINGQVNIQLNIPPKKGTEISPVVKEKVEEYATAINSIIQQEKILMEAELKVLKAKNLDENAFNREKTEISEKYAEKIDKRIEELGFDLDDVIQKQVRYSLLNSDITSEEELKANILKKYRPTRSLDPYFTYGIMNLTNNLPDNALDRNMGYNSNLEFGLKLNYQFSRTSPWGLTSGVGFSWRTLRLDNNMIFTKDNSTNVSVEPYGGTAEKSKLRTGYLMVPLGLHYNFSKVKNVGMDIEYRSYKNGFRAEANLYGGVRMSTNNIVKGDGEDFRNRANYQVNPFIYGGQLTFSYNSLSLFIKKDFSSYFKGSNFPNDKALVIGIGLGL